MTQAARPAFNSTLRRTHSIGELRKQRLQNEAAAVTVLEGTKDRLGLFDLHRVDWLHFADNRQDRGSLKAGCPDYWILWDGGLGFLETKARNPETGRPGKLSAAQHAFHDKLRRSGADVLTALLPDDLEMVNAWLRGKTGRDVVINA